MLSHDFYIIIDYGVSGPVNIGEVVDGINSTRKGFLFQLMETVKPPYKKGYNKHMVMHSSTSTTDVS